MQTILGTIQIAVLLTVKHKPEMGCAPVIRQAIEVRTGKSIFASQVNKTVEGLYNQGYLKCVGKRELRGRGRHPMFYQITKSGEAALEEALTLTRMFDDETAP